MHVPLLYGLFLHAAIASRRAWWRLSAIRSLGVLGVLGALGVALGASSSPESSLGAGLLSSESSSSESCLGDLALMLAALAPLALFLGAAAAAPPPPLARFLLIVLWDAC